MGRIDLVDFDGEAQGPPDRGVDQKAGSAAWDHRQIGCINVRLRGPDLLGSCQSRPPPRPLVDPFQNRPYRLDSGVDDPPFIEMEGGRFSSQWGDMIVAHGTTVVCKV